MYLKKALLLITVLGFMFFFSLSAYAAPTEEEKKESDFYKTFDIKEDEVTSSFTDSKFGLYQLNQGVSKEVNEADLGLKDIFDFGFFSFTKSFGKSNVVTFATSKMLSGQGEASSTIGFCVYNNNEDGKLSRTQESIQTLGAAGLYNDFVSLKTGDNFVVIAAKKDQTLLYRLYKITVKEAETKGLLENIEINFITTYEPSSKNADAKPSANLKPIVTIK